MHEALPVEQRIFLAGMAGSAKTSLAVLNLRRLLGRSGTERVLVLAPQRSLLAPYQAALRQSDLPAGEEADTLTIGGLARRSIELVWPAIAADCGFTQPASPPTFLTLETAQYYMERVVRPFMAEQFYFEGVHLSDARIFSQLLDALNKAALAGFSYREIGARLREAWDGPSAQTTTFAQVQTCADRFRDFCLANNLLDFSLQIDIFRQLLTRDWFRDQLYARYQHLIVDNVEEDAPVTHELLRAWLPHAQSALIVYDTDAGYRTFLGADARSAYELREVCDQTIELRESHVMSNRIQHLEAQVTRILGGHSELPTRTSPKPSPLAIEFGGGRFHPEMLDWTAARIDELIKQGTPASDVVVLSPFLGDALRFALEERLRPRGIATRSLRPSRTLNEETVSRSLITLAELAYPDWQIVPPQADVTQALIASIEHLDPARGHLLAERLYRVKDGRPELNPFDLLKPELQDRIGFEMGARYERLRGWLIDRRADPAPLDHFIARLFGEVLSQPGFGFHRQIDPGRITAQLVESARRFRQTVDADPYDAAIDPRIARDYVRLVTDGVVAATFVPPAPDQRPEAVLLAPAYTFLLSNESVSYQFWLNAGSAAWWERLYQPLTHPYVLSRRWPAGQKWTDADEQTARRETLQRLVRGLLRRCRAGVYLGISTLNEQGFEERGPLLRLIQQILRENDQPPV